MDARNQHVKEGLQKAYATRTPGKTLQVFCVSNTWYETFSEEGSTAMVKASGIPELRQFCHSITADAQLLEARHFLRSTLPSLLNSVEIWASNHNNNQHRGSGSDPDLIYETLGAAQPQVRLINSLLLLQLINEGRHSRRILACAFRQRV